MIFFGLIKGRNPLEISKIGFLKAIFYLKLTNIIFLFIILSEYIYPFHIYIDLNYDNIKTNIWK